VRYGQIIARIFSGSWHGNRDLGLLQPFAELRARAFFFRFGRFLIVLTKSLIAPSVPVRLPSSYSMEPHGKYAVNRLLRTFFLGVRTNFYRRINDFCVFPCKSHPALAIGGRFVWYLDTSSTYMLYSQWQLCLNILRGIGLSVYMFYWC
jgi:hypothetical protein